MRKPRLFAVRHSFSVSALKKAIRTWPFPPSFTSGSETASFPEAEKGVSSVSFGIGSA